MTQCDVTFGECYPKTFGAKHIGRLVLCTANQLGKTVGELIVNHHQSCLLLMFCVTQYYVINAYQVCSCEHFLLYINSLGLSFTQSMDHN